MEVGFSPESINKTTAWANEVQETAEKLIQLVLNPPQLEITTTAKD